MLIAFRHTMASKLLYGDDGHAEDYAKFRPTYTKEIYQAIYEFCEKDKGNVFDYGLAVDVGCGNGQSTLPLCAKFRKVIGCDISPAQIKYAKREHSHLKYKICPGENMTFLKDRSVDLVTLGTALHWLDRETFYQEVDRVLKPGGVMAAYGYGSITMHEKNADDVFEYFYNTICPYWEEGHFSCRQLYRDIDIPFTEQHRFDQGELHMMTQCSVDHFIGLLSSVHAYRDMCKDKPANTLLEDARTRLRNIYGTRDMTIDWTSYMLLGRKLLTKVT